MLICYFLFDYYIRIKIFKKKPEWSKEWKSDGDDVPKKRRESEMKHDVTLAATKIIAIFDSLFIHFLHIHM